MEKSNKRGKIPQSDWPLIMARYEAGETLASIARTYDCSPPAISYVVSKSRARQPVRDSAEAGPSGAEPQLIKGIASETAEGGFGRRPRPAAPAAHGGADRAMSTGFDTAAPPTQPLGNGHDRNGHDHRTPREAARETDGLLRDDFAERGPQPSQAQAPGGTGNGRPAPVGTGSRNAASSPLSRGEADTRHRLHLSLGNGAASHNGSSELVFPSADRPIIADSRPAQPHTARPPYPTPSRAGAAGFSEAGPGPGQPLHSNGNGTGSEAAPRKESAGLFIDRELRARVDTDIAVFLAAFDAALIEDTQENRSALREATDRLMRAGARTRIELERLEARVPLTAHDRGRADPGAWRYR
jgi:hypothetical protein